MSGACVFDDANNRVLDGHFESNDEMTVEMCLDICRSKGFRYAGLEWQLECHCGNEPDGGFEWAWPDKCDDRCSGNSNQICGGSNAMSVYTTPNKNPNGLCIYDFPENRRVLNGYSITGDSNMYVEYCRDICSGCG